MNRSLFQTDGQFYKANLHVHTTVSDGSLTPEETKQAYLEKGYSVVAFSDHEILLSHPELRDEGFLPLTATEYEFRNPNDPRNFACQKVYHIVLIAGRENETYYPWATRSVFWGNAKNYVQDYCQGEHSRYPDYRNVNSAAKDAHDHGFLVTFCHPGWSLNHYPDYCGLEHVDFVEVSNSSSFISGRNTDGSDRAFEDLLCLGKHVSPTCSDDAHSRISIGHGATYVKSPDLSYESIIASLRRGDSYASTGPKFKDLSFDPETCVFTVDSDPVEVISLTTNIRTLKSAGRRFTNTVVDHAEFDLKNFVDTVRKAGLFEDSFVRVTLFTENGRYAYSRGYFLTELLPETSAEKE